jgi:hypothetical protein
VIQQYVIQQFVSCDARRRACGAAAALVLLAGCGSRVAEETRYRGTLAGCGAPMPASLVAGRGSFAFAPGEGVLVIRGSVGADGAFAGSLDTQPPGKPPFVLSVQGRLDPAAAEVAYATPRCQASGRLTAVPVSLLP